LIEPVSDFFASVAMQVTPRSTDQSSGLGRR
jgi:hypothetical protein